MAEAGNRLNCCLRFVLLMIIFCYVLLLGAVKGLIVGPVAASILIVGNISVIFGSLPPHVYWTVSTTLKTSKFDLPFKIAHFIVLPALLGLWLGLSIIGSVLVALGYGFITPWISTFEAFRHQNTSDKLYHSLVDGTWQTIRGSCTVVSDFADICWHSYPAYLNELKDTSLSDQCQTLRFINIPGFIVAGLVGLIVDIPLFTAIAVIKSPYMLFRGWYRLIHDLISREGPFLETACIPIAGLAIVFWPVAVGGCIILAILSSIFVGLYATVIVYQERSFWRGVAFAVAMVAEFDEYTNDGLYLKEGTFLPKPRFRRKEALPDISTQECENSHPAPSETPAMFPSLGPSRSVREVIQEVKMIQIWGAIMKSCEIHGKELLDEGALTTIDLENFLKAKSSWNEVSIVSVGLPCSSLLQTILFSINAGSDGFLIDGVEITTLNRPNDKLMEWFFHPLLVVKDQIRAVRLARSEEKFLQKVVLYGNDAQRIEAWENGGVVLQEGLRAAQVQGISRRMLGIMRSVSKIPTYRRRYRQVVKTLLMYQQEKEGLFRSNSIRSGSEKSVANVDKTSSFRSVNSAPTICDV